MDEAPRIPIGVITDHKMVGEGLARLVDGLNGYAAVLEAGDLEEYRSLSRSAAPRIVLMDWRMPGARAAVEWMKAEQKGTRVLVFAPEFSEGDMLKSVHAGACGILEKCCGGELLKVALDQVSTTGHYHTDAVHQAMLRNPDGLTAEERRAARLKAQIKGRRLEVLQLLCTMRNATDVRMAARLGLEKRTVEWVRGGAPGALRAGQAYGDGAGRRAAGDSHPLGLRHSNTEDKRLSLRA